jgi:outer membrane protein, heavy metal efflux system
MTPISLPCRRMPRIVWLPLALLALVTVTGCASVPKDAGFSDVRRTVAGRLDQEPEWPRTDQERERVRTPVKELLANELTADNAVRIALLNNRALRVEYARLGVSQADLVQAGLLQNPVLRISRISGDAGYELTIDVVQDLVGLLTLSARRNVTSSLLESVKLQVAQEALRLAADVKVAYYTLEGDEQALELFQTAIDATQAAAELAKRQRDAGNLNRREQTLQQAFYAQTVLQASRAEVQIRADRERLNRLMGLWSSDTEWRLPKRLPEVPKTIPGFPRLESLAVEQRLDLAAARKEVEAVAQVLALNRNRRFLNTLGIGYEFFRDTDGSKLSGPVLEFSVPLFDRGQARIAGQQARLERSMESFAALAVNIRSELREARDRLLLAHQQLDFYRDVLLPQQQIILDETVYRYNGMLLGVYELLQVKQGQLNTAREYIETLRDYWVAHAELERVAGGRLPASLAETAPRSASPAPTETAPAQEHQHQPGDK